MRIRLLITLLTLVIAGCAIQDKLRYDEVRKVAKQKLVPPGTIWLRDSTFMDITEVRNLDYLEFMYWTRRLDSTNYKSILPDTTCWWSSGMATGPYIDYYLRHPAYWDYPVVGVSYDQAVSFCKWREDRINQCLYIKKHPLPKNAPPDSIWRINAPRYIECRLPNREEWEYSSAAGLSSGFNYGYVSLTTSDSIPVSNTKESCYFKSSDLVHPVKSGSPNHYGIYNLLGNVSEIIQDSCFKGLNFETTLDGATMKSQPEKYQRIDTLRGGYDYHFTFRYTKPAGWLGFRCICVVKQIP